MKVAVLGVWHVHTDEYTRTAKELGEVVGVWDENEGWKADFAARHGIRAFNTLDALLASDAEAVIVCSATDRHTEYILRAVASGKHIFTEKVLALTNEDAEMIAAAVKAAGVRFAISFPWLARAGVRALHRAVEDGMVGEVNYLRFRNCHNGSLAHWLPAHFYDKKTCGGGAMIDLGAHGMYLAHHVLGEPVSYASAFTHVCHDEKDALLNPDGIEDNAVTVMTFENGAIAVNETGFVSSGLVPTYEIGGERGYLIFSGEKAIFRGADGQTVDLPMEAAPTSLVYFLRGEEAAGAGIEEAVALTRMMVGAYAHVSSPLSEW